MTNLMNIKAYCTILHYDAVVQIKNGRREEYSEYHAHEMISSVSRRLCRMKFENAGTII